MSKWRTILLSCVGFAMMPAAAIADLTITSVTPSSNMVTAGGTLDITVNIDYTGGTDWEGTSFHLQKAGENTIEIFCDPNLPDNQNGGAGSQMQAFMNVPIPNYVAGSWTLETRVFDGNECGNTPEADEASDTSEVLDITLNGGVAAPPIELDLILCLDGSTSISGTEWNLQLDGTQAGLSDALVPFGLNSTVRLTVITFASDVDVAVGPTVIDSQMTLDNFNAAIDALVQPGGFTNTSGCISAAHAVLCESGTCPDDTVDRVIDISTDGNPTVENCPPGPDPQECAVQRSMEAETAGVDVLNVIGVGDGIDQMNMEEWVFPDPVLVFDTGAMPPEFPMEGDRGFVVLVSDFTDYEPAISAKIAAETSTTFVVNKEYSDNNMTPVMVMLSCTGDTVIDPPNPTAAAPGAPAMFAISGFDPMTDTCTATEVGGLPIGYTADESGCVDVLISDPGQCTITNNRNTAQFTVNKDFVPDNAMGSVMVTLTCGGTTTVDSANPTAATEAAPAMFDVSGFGPADTCTATEGTPPVGYTADESDCQDNMDLANGGSCTIINTLNTAQFTVNKDFDPDDPMGSVMVTLSCGGTTSIDSANPTAATEAAPAVFDVSGFGMGDTCTATEGTPPAGYSADESDCQDNQDLANGGSCTIVNTLNSTTFTVTKSYNDDNMDPVSVTLMCTGATTIDPPNPAMAAPGAPAMFTVNGFMQGDTCTATEVEPPGYTWSNPMDCAGVNVLDPGTCNLNNNVNRTTFTVTKSYGDDSMDPVSVTLMCTGVNTMVEPPNPAMASPGVPAQFAVLGFEPGVDTCTATEMVPPGYDWTNPLDCENVGLPEPGTCNLNNAPIEIDLAKTVDGPPTLEMNGTYTVFYTITATNNGAGGGVYDIIDAFSPGTGIMLNTASATYDVGVGEDDQSGMLGNFPMSGTIVTGEGLAGGQFETWSVEANFTVDPAMVDPADSDCTPGQAVPGTGFYNEVMGSDTDPTPGNNDDCEGLPDPEIDLIKTVVADSVTLEANGTYTVQYTIEANNLGDGPGMYDIVDNVAPGVGISLNTATIAYQNGVGEDNRSGTIVNAYPSMVTGEALAGQQFERWTLTVNFTVDPPNVDPGTADCTPGMPITGNGFYNEVSGSATDPNPGNNADCDGLPDPVIDLSKEVTNFVDNGGGSFTVTYTVTATNTGDGPGFYDLIDNVLPGSGIIPTPPDPQQLTSYNAGSESDQSGMLAGMLPYTFTNGELLVDDEALAGQRNESWTIVVNFQIEGGQVGSDYLCAGPGTGTYNEVEGSSTDPNLGNNNDCEDPPELRTTFRVTKDFSDDNPLGVTVEIQCNTGLPLQQSGVVHDPDAAGLQPGDFTVIEFIVGDFEIGTMDCDIEEVIPAGYEPDYTAGATTGIAVDIFDDADGCHYEDISFGTFTCGIYNELQPVDVVVEKQWIDENPAFQSPTWVEITLECDGPIEGGYPCFGGRSDPSNYCIQQYIDPANPGEFEVFPHFEGTTCSATEDPIVGVLTDESDCEEMIVFPGQGDSCVIVNTRLYAGIPTLNQYGLILLALLMLGIGAVAYRRFA